MALYCPECNALLSDVNLSGISEHKYGCSHDYIAKKEDYSHIRCTNWPSAKYLIWSNEHTCWWCANSCGYSYDIKAAGRYTREEAMKICKGANYGFMQDNGKNPNEIPVLEADAIETMSAKPWVAPLKTYDCHNCHDQGCDLCKADYIDAGGRSFNKFFGGKQI